MKITIPGLRLESEANKRDKWNAVKRAKLQRAMVANTLAFQRGQFPALPLIVTIVRVGVGRLDDDNLARACKAVRDAIAKHYGVDDGDGTITWRYWQRKGKPREYACELLIEPRDIPLIDCDSVETLVMPDGIWAINAANTMRTWKPNAQQLRAFIVQCEAALAELMEREQ